MTVDINLPPLPEPIFIGDHEGYGEYFEAEDMQDYARAAIEADRQQRGEPLSALAALVNALRDRHYGRMPDDVQAAYDRAWSIVYAAPQPAAPALEPGVPECPYPCGWESLHKLAVHDGAYLARALDVGQILTDNQRATAIVASIRLIEVCRAMLKAQKMELFS